MNEPRAFLRNEIANVQSELIAFRDEYIPVFLDCPLLESMPDHVPDFVREQAVETSHRISSWQGAITKVSEALPISGQQTTRIKTADFEDFMFTGATPGFEHLNDGIRWRISLMIRLDWEYCCGWPLCLEQQERAEDRERVFFANLPQIKDWLMGLSVTDSVLLNALCMILPFIADVDQAFAKLALDLETWRSLVTSYPQLSEEERRKSLDEIDHGHFLHAINNALLHVFAALGNNHFMSIRDYLDHPCLYGSYTGLMPHYLFALLFQKVSILQQLTSADEDCDTIVVVELVEEGE